MSNLLKKIEADILMLSKQERAFLADRLLSSLDGEVMTDIDMAWIAEAEIRYQEYKDGKRPGIEAQSVFEKADKLFK
ncbi:MAG: addiction module protein [Pseudomonadota bacterium]